MEGGKRFKSYDWLHTAIEYNNFKQCEKMIKSGFVNINIRHGNMNETPLMRAVRLDRMKIFKLLLTHKDIDLDAQYSNGVTVLMQIVVHNRYDMLKYILLHKKPQLNAVDTDGYTALMWVIDQQCVDITKLLLSLPDVDINIGYDANVTPLMMASQYNDVVAATLLLYHCNIDITLRDVKGFNAFDYAVQNGNVEIVKLFLTRGLFVVPLGHILYSDGIKEMIRNKNHYLMRWNRFKTHKYYPTFV